MFTVRTCLHGSFDVSVRLNPIKCDPGPWSCTGIFVIIDKKYIVWIKFINFYFMPKIIRILRTDHVP